MIWLALLTLRNYLNYKRITIRYKSSGQMGSEKESKEEENNEESTDSLKVPSMEDIENEDHLEDISADSSDEGTRDGDFSELKKYQDEAKENYQKYLYAMAEIDNMKKRHIKERSELTRYNGEHIARDVLEILDDLERTCDQGSEISPEVLLEGVNLITSRMKSILERHQVKVEDSIGKMFDPQKHEALTMSPSDDSLPGTIIHQLKKAYYFKDKLLRPAQVVVACENKSSGKEEPSEPDEE
jgi:molecular chaperone GrpE